MGIRCFAAAARGVSRDAIRSPWQILSQWKEQGKAAEDHVGALYNLGRMTRGRGISESKADWERHDAMQLGLQDDPMFADLLVAIQDSIPELDQKGLSRVLMGLGDTHEDLPFGHATTPNAHLRRLFAVVEGTCARLLSTWIGVPSASLDDRDLGFPLFALSRLGIYDEKVFQTASGLLAAKLGEDPPLPTQGLRQWLLACNSLNHSLAEFSESIAGYKPSESWIKEEDSRLHQMAGALAHLPTPDPLLSNVIGEVIARPPSHLQGSKAVALYGLKVVDLLSKAGCLQSDAQLPSEHSRVLDQALEQKSKVVRRASHLENVLGNALARCGFEPCQDVVVSPGLSADFQCTFNGNNFFVEVEGPSHFCVRPFWRPRGRAVLKQRVFASQGWPLVSIPYWIAAPPGAYIRRGLPGRPPSLEVSEKELKDLVKEQLDVWHSTCKEHQVRQWWAADRVEKADNMAAALELLFKRPVPPAGPAVAA